MEISEFFFKLLLLFFPGILCAYSVDHLTTHRPREWFFFLLQSFVFGLIAYFLYWLGLNLVHSLWPNKVTLDMNFMHALVDSGVPFSFQEIAIVSVVGIALSCLIIVGSRFKMLNRFANRIGITNKFGELDVWGYMLNMKDVVWVTVRDHVNDVIYDGWIQAFSDDSQDAELLLRDVSLYKNSTGKRLYQVGAVYLSRNREDISIECRTLPISDIVKWKEDANE